jgi:hypothetical protein
MKEHLSAPHLALAQIFQLQGCGQYGLRGSIVNVPTNLNIIQIVLPWMSYEDYSISIFLKRK